MSSTTLKEALSVCLGRGLTFAAFRPPGAPITIWAQRTPDLDRVEPALLYELNDVFLLASFSADNGAIPLIRSDVELTFGDVAAATSELLVECEGRTPTGTPDQPFTSQADFEHAVRTAQERISPNGLQKVVLSRTISVDLERALLADLFIQACGSSPDVLVTLMHTPDHGTWLGASPERSLIAEDDMVQVDALAGSIATEEAPSDPMQWGGKERHEQEVVSLAVFGDLMRWGSRNVRASGPSVIHAGAVAHLRTVFEAERSERGLDELLVALHPTPAVCGAPRHLAQAVIAELESHDRSLYGGFWGPWNADGRSELFVNIRCLRSGQNRAVLYVGAGITEGSDPRNEWIETEQKAQTWLKPIAALRA